MTITVKIPYSSSSKRNSVWKEAGVQEILSMKTIDQGKKGIKRLIELQFISLISVSLEENVVMVKMAAG
jgi:hypothetical protein